MTAHDASATTAVTGYFRLAWVVDKKNPHIFGQKFFDLNDARTAAREVNRIRRAQGLKPCNYVAELRPRRRRQIALGRYETANLIPLDEKPSE